MTTLWLTGAWVEHCWLVEGPGGRTVPAWSRPGTRAGAREDGSVWRGHRRDRRRVLLAGSWIFVAAQDTVPRWRIASSRAVNDLSNFWWVLVWGPMQIGSLLGSLVVVALTGVISRIGA